MERYRKPVNANSYKNDGEEKKQKRKAVVKTNNYGAVQRDVRYVNKEKENGETETEKYLEKNTDK